MKVTIKENSLYKTFESFTPLEINFVIKTFQKELSTINLLQRQFGEKYDGMNAKKDLQYYEKNRLDMLLIRFENRLKYVHFMLLNKHKYSDIEEIFKGKKDYEIDKIAASFKMPNKEKNKIVIYKNTLEMQKKLETTPKQLLDASEFLPTYEHRFICKRTYGLGVNSLNELQIRSMLNITEEQYKTYLEEVCKQLPDLVLKVKKMESEREPIAKTPRKKIVIPSINKKEEKKKIPKEKSLGNKSGKKRKKSFLNYFFKETENLSVSEVKRVRLAIAYQAYYAKKGYEAFCILYDKDTLLLKENAKIESNLKSNFSQFVRTIRSLLNENSLSDLEEKVKKIEEKKEKSLKKESSNKRRYKLKNIFEYFFTEKMTPEQKSVTVEKAKLAIIYQSKITKSAYKDFCAVYNPVTGDLIEDSLRDKKIRFGSNQFIKKIKILMETYTLEELKSLLENQQNNQENVKKKSKNLLPSFLDYFYDDKMSLEEQKAVEQKFAIVFSFIKLRSKSYADFKLAYDENTWKLKENVELSLEQIKNVKRFRTRIIKEIYSKDLKELQEEYKRKREVLLPSFLDYFCEDKMSLKEKDEIKEKVLLVLMIEKCRANKLYEIFISIYNETSLTLNEEISSYSYFRLERFIEHIRKLITLYNKDELRKKCAKAVLKQEKEKLERIKNEEYRQNITESIREAKVPKKNEEYLDSLIAKCYEISEDSDFILSILKISQSTLIDFYINLTNLKSPEKVVDYILKNDSTRVSEILVSGLFGDFRNALTIEEQQFAHFRLLQRVDDTITDEIISKRLNIDVEYLQEYEFMTNDERTNRLNDYIRKREIK